MNVQLLWQGPIFPVGAAMRFLVGPQIILDESPGEGSPHPPHARVVASYLGGLDLCNGRYDTVRPFRRTDRRHPVCRCLQGRPFCVDGWKCLGGWGRDGDMKPIGMSAECLRQMPIAIELAYRRLLLLHIADKMHATISHAATSFRWEGHLSRHRAHTRFSGRCTLCTRTTCTSRASQGLTSSLEVTPAAHSLSSAKCDDETYLVHICVLVGQVHLLQLNAATICGQLHADWDIAQRAITACTNKQCHFVAIWSSHLSVEVDVEARGQL